jgi:hypothetical protein
MQEYNPSVDRRVKPDMQETNLEIGNGKRVGWTLKGLAEATDTSVAFWKKTISRGEIPATKAGALTIILNEDVRAYFLKNRRVRGKAA